MLSHEEMFQHYKERLLAQAKNTKPGDRFFDGTIPPLTGWTRYGVIEYVCSFPKLDPVRMAVELTQEGITIYYDDSAISERENKNKERRVLKAAEVLRVS
jgi:hypothetical protein